MVMDMLEYFEKLESLVGDGAERDLTLKTRKGYFTLNKYKQLLHMYNLPKFTKFVIQ